VSSVANFDLQKHLDLRVVASKVELLYNSYSSVCCCYCFWLVFIFCVCSMAACSDCIALVGTCYRICNNCVRVCEATFMM